MNLFNCLFFAAAAGAAPTVVDHVRLTFGADASTTIVVSWASNTTAPGVACYAPVSGAGAGACVAAVAADNSYANSAGLRVTYRADITGLAPKTRYSYNVSVGAAVSGAYSFTTLPARDDPAAAAPVVLYWADLGRDGGGQALPALEAEAAKTAAGAPGAALCGVQNGDFAYNLGDENGLRGSQFMSRMSNVWGFLPSFTTIGNHELPKDLLKDVNASHYVNMLGSTMPGSSGGSYYSVDVGLMHLVFLSSEVYALGPYGGVTGAAQDAWLAADLAGVDRQQTPWVVAFAHRPFYCSNANSWCGADAWAANPVRLALEPAFAKGGVDVFIAGHEHSVELIYPTVNGVAQAHDWTEPKATTHIVSGVGGCNETSGECLNPMGPPAGDWSAARLAGDPVQYGFSKLWAPNATVFSFQQWQSSVGPEPVLWRQVDVVQHSHGPFV